jgi:signal transduction histidine kinase
LVLNERDIERLDLSDDRLIFGLPEEPSARFELAPMVTLLCERGFELPSLERRKMRALSAQVEVPVLQNDGLWHLLLLDGGAFIARRARREQNAIDEQVGWFYSPPELQRALVDRLTLPVGFALDFEGTNEGLGVALRPRVDLPDSPLAFTLRHPDPDGLGRAEASRLRILRGALLTLAFACAAGGFLTARVIARQRKLAELKSGFIAGVSHDLRTPLASILLLAENLETGVAREEDRGRYHRALRKEAMRLRRLVDDVLDFSRLERGAAPRIERQDVELEFFVLGLEGQARERIEGEGRVFRFERGQLPQIVHLDDHAVQRALENLIDNALKHGRGAVELSISAASGRIAFTVSDEGPGVPPSERERVFESFERLEGSNGHEGGTGLGLAIVRSIARAHGGEASVRSRPDGTGAVFVLELPVEEVPA